MNTKFESVSQYIDSFPDEIQILLQAIRRIILENAPGASESISYNMPAYKLFGKPLVYFAGFAKHIGLYATPTGHAVFKNELAMYKQGKGSVQFPLDHPLPESLIQRIVLFRVEENKMLANKKN